MSTIFRNNYSAGLCPSDDIFNGRQNALLRMDNLFLDDNGVVELTRGTGVIGTPTNTPLFWLYSKYISGTKNRYVHYNGKVVSDTGNFSSPRTIIGSASPTHATFGNGFGMVLACSGSGNTVKDDGSTVRNLGIHAPGAAPSVASVGGAGNVNGNYQYIQVDVAALSAYLGQSPGSAATAVTAIVGSATLTPYETGMDSQVTTHYWFRFGGTLDTYYFVGSSATGGTFTDNVSDATALLIDIKLNQFLAAVNAIPDEILSISGPISGRMLYMTFKYVYISEQYNIDSYDTRNIIQLSSSTVGEKNLFLAPANATVNLCGTTSNVYEISGTLTLNADGTLDVTTKPYNINPPPINEAFAIYNNTLYYVANDGIRYLNGTVSVLMDNNLDLLFKGFARYSSNAFLIAGGNTVAYRLCVYRNKLIFLAYETGGLSATTYIWDFQKTYWYLWNLFPATYFVEEDGTLLLGGTDGVLRQGDVNYYLDSNVTLQSIFFQTCFSSEELLQRKDLFHIRLLLDTGNSFVDIALQSETTTYGVIESIACNGLTEVYIPLHSSSYNLAKRLSLRITDTASGGVNFFRLVEWSIEYTSRPIPEFWLRVPPDQYGVAGRKRITEIPFVIDTLGNPINAFPVLDNVVGAAQSITTSNKTRASLFFTAETYATDIGVIFDAAPSGIPFEFYNLLTPNIVEKLPDPVKFYRIPADNLGTPSRKRIIHYAFIIDTKGQNVTFTPFVDGVASAPHVFSTNGKTTFIHSFISDTVGTDIWGTIDGGGNIFEYYGLNLGECVLEKLPPPANFIRIPPTNLGTAGRKRISTIALIIDTKGQNVTFQPYIDGNITGPSATYNTTGKRTVLYNYTSETIGTDFWGTLTGSTTQTIFEYYGIDLEESVTEKMPIIQDYLLIPETNLGVASRKRVRTVPFTINTFGGNVFMTPVVDNVQGTPQAVNTPRKSTAFYYFNTDSFGVDYSFILSGGQFEFYGLEKPEDVETLPVGKVFDQCGPVDFTKVGKILELRLRCLSFGSNMIYTIYAQDAPILTSNFATVPGTDQNYTVKLPQGTIGNVVRIEFRDANGAVFHRWKCELRVNLGGMKTEQRTFKL